MGKRKRNLSMSAHQLEREWEEKDEFSSYVHLVCKANKIVLFPIAIEVGGKGGTVIFFFFILFSWNHIYTSWICDEHDIYTFPECYRTFHTSCLFKVFEFMHTPFSHTDYALFRAYLTMIPSWFADVLSSSFTFPFFHSFHCIYFSHLSKDKCVRIFKHESHVCQCQLHRCFNSGVAFEIKKPECWINCSRILILKVPFQDDWVNKTDRFAGQLAQRKSDTIWCRSNYGYMYKCKLWIMNSLNVLIGFSLFLFDRRK